MNLNGDIDQTTIDPQPDLTKPSTKLPIASRLRRTNTNGIRTYVLFAAAHHIDEEILLHNRYGTFYSGEEKWNECMAELYWVDLDESLWMFEEYKYAEVMDLKESSWMFDEE